MEVGGHLLLQCYGGQGYRGHLPKESSQHDLHRGAVVCTKHALRIEEPFAKDLQHYTTTPLWTHLVQSLLNFSHFFCVFFGIDH